LLVVFGERGDLLLELATVVGLAEPGLAPGRLAEGAGEVGLPMPQNGDLRRTSNDHTTSTSQDFLPAQN